MIAREMQKLLADDEPALVGVERNVKIHRSDIVMRIERVNETREKYGRECMVIINSMSLTYGVHGDAISN